MAGTVPPPTVGEPNSTGDPKYIAAIKRFNELLNSENLLTTASLAAAAGITSGQLADGAATSQKAKLTAGAKTTSSEITFSDANYKDLGATLEITPAVASQLLVWVTVDLNATSSAFFASLKVDSAAEETRTLRSQSASFAGTLSQFYVISLTAAAHTIKLRGKQTTGSPGAVTVFPTNTGFMYLLLAS